MCPFRITGAARADYLGKRLARRKFEGLYASDLKRARETAAIISKHLQHNCLEIETLPELRELNFGRWEGMTMQDVAKFFDDDYKRWGKTLSP